MNDSTHLPSPLSLVSVSRPLSLFAPFGVGLGELDSLVMQAYHVHGSQLTGEWNPPFLGRGGG